MKKGFEDKHVKRTQRDYSMTFKLSVVEEIQEMGLTPTEVARKYGIQSRSTIRDWIEKYGTFDKDYQTSINMPKTQERQIKELEQKVKLLEKQKSFLEQQVETADKKAIIFDMMISLAEKEYNIPIRKKCSPEQSISIEKKQRKL